MRERERDIYIYIIYREIDTQGERDIQRERERIGESEKGIEGKREKEKVRE